MELNFLGIGAAYNPMMKNTSAYFIVNETLILFDCGETVFEELYRRDIFKSVDRFLVAITHFHSDHIGSLGSLISYCSCRIKKEIIVCYPQKDICDLLEKIGVSNSMYQYCSDFEEDNLSLNALSVQHDPMIDCYGYLVAHKNLNFFYGGDSIEVPKPIMRLLQCGKIDKVYQDTTYKNKQENTGHGSLESLLEQVHEPLRHKIVCMHFDHDFRKDIAINGFGLAMV